MLFSEQVDSSFVAIMTSKRWMLIFVLLLAITVIDAGQLDYMQCQDVCSEAVVACYKAAGLDFGTKSTEEPKPEVWKLAAKVACHIAFGQCSAACTAMVLAPTPSE